MQAMISNQMGGAADVQVEINQGPPGVEPHIEIHQIPQQLSTTSGTSTTTGPNTGVDSSQDQPRVTTATHPTTSTQTRSTARPQIHVTGLPTGQVRNLRSVPIPSMQLSSFDRYLPCNSHHIRDNEQRENQQQQQENAARRPRIHIQAPAVPRGSIPTALANLLRSRRGSNTTSTQSTSTPTTTATTSSGSSAEVTEAGLDTLVPIFGSNHVQLQVRDLLNVYPSPSTLNRVRVNLRNYVATTLSLDASATEDDVSLAVDQVLTLIEHYLTRLSGLSSEDFDARASIEKLIRDSLPFILNLIREDESTEFGGRLLREIITFSKRFSVILLKAVGRTSAQRIIMTTVDTIFTNLIFTDEGNGRAALQWLNRHIRGEILRKLRNIRSDCVDVIEFLVIRAPSTEAEETEENGVPPIEATSTRNSVSPMETDDDDGAVDAAMAIEATETNDEPPEDLEPLPTVTIGSEGWHQNFAAPWLPIITRDISRQRRQV